MMNDEEKSEDEKEKLHTYDPKYTVLATEVLTRVVGDKFVVKAGGKLALGGHVGLLFGMPYSLS